MSWRLVPLCWCAAALFVVDLRAEAPPDILERGQHIAHRSSLMNADCPLEKGPFIPAYFRYSQEGPSPVAEAAILLPVSYAEAMHLIQDVEDYPEWVLAGPDGLPNLQKLFFDPETGEGGVVVASSEDGLFRGSLTRQFGTERSGIHVDIHRRSRLKGAGVDIVAHKPIGCPEASLVTVRSTWKMSFLVRWFAPKIMIMPAVFTLAIRDDLAAHVIDDEKTAGALLGVPVEQRSGLLVIGGRPPGLQEDAGWPPAGQSIKRIEPAALRLGEESRRALSGVWHGRAVGRELSERKLLLTFLEAVSGPHEIVGYDLSWGDPPQAGAARFGGTSADVAYSVQLVVAPDGKGRFRFEINEPLAR
jgi:hypothetical protein